MAKKSVGSLIRELINEKNLSFEQVASLVKKSRQQVYNDCNRVNWKDDEIDRYAQALGLDKGEIYQRLEKTGTGEKSEYLFEHLSKLEDQFKQMADQFKAQLEVKDRQIEKLLDLLGKLDLGENTPCAKEYQLYYKTVA